MSVDKIVNGRCPECDRRVKTGLQVGLERWKRVLIHRAGCELFSRRHWDKRQGILHLQQGGR
jgi:hypothetical protein